MRRLGPDARHGARRRSARSRAACAGRCTDESIDELALYLGVGEAVAEMTRRWAGLCATQQIVLPAPHSLPCSAMGGSTRFEDALAARLAVMRPSRKAVEAFVASHPPQYTPGRPQPSAGWLGPRAQPPTSAGCAGIPELVGRLQQQGKAVFLVSGGFHAIIDPIAEHLGLPPEHVFANVILFEVRSSLAYLPWGAQLPVADRPCCAAPS